MSKIGGASGEQPQYTPEEIRKYKEDYQRSYDLFQRAFNDYTQPNIEVHKKAQLQKVMGEALQVMNETACVALKREKMDDERRLSNDYSEFIQNPAPENQKKVLDDLHSLSDR